MKLIPPVFAASSSRKRSPRLSSITRHGLGIWRRVADRNGVDLCVGFHRAFQQFFPGVAAVIVHSVGNDQQRSSGYGHRNAIDSDSRKSYRSAPCFRRRLRMQPCCRSSSKWSRETGVCPRACRHGIEKCFVGGIGVLHQSPQRFFGGAEDAFHTAAQVKYDSHRDWRVLLAERAYLLPHAVLGQRECIACQSVDDGSAAVDHGDRHQDQRGIGTEGRDFRRGTLLCSGGPCTLWPRRPRRRLSRRRATSPYATA